MNLELFEYGKLLLDYNININPSLLDTLKSNLRKELLIIRETNRNNTPQN